MFHVNAGFIHEHYLNGGKITQFVKRNPTIVHPPPPSPEDRVTIHNCVPFPFLSISDVLYCTVYSTRITIISVERTVIIMSLNIDTVGWFDYFLSILSSE